MTKQEYAEYQAAVAHTFKINNLSHLTSAYIPDGESESMCECCGSHLGGDRIHSTGINTETDEVLCFDICIDCQYYTEYGQLDDMTMLDMGKL